MKQVLKIANGATPVLEATTQINLIDDVILVSLNWDETVVDYETAPKMIGEGSYEIAATVPERTIEATFNCIGDWSVRLRDLTALARAKTELTFTKIKTGTAENKTETQVLKGKIKLVGPDRASETWSDIKIVILCKDPTPVITIV